MALFVGIDAGSSVIKVAAFDADGRARALVRRDIRIDFSKAPFVELDIDNYWQICSDCLRELVKMDPSLTKEIISISVTSQGSTFVLIDSKGNPLKYAISWMDTRATNEAEEILNRLSSGQIYRTTGQPEMTSYLVPSKLFWLKKIEPHLLERATKILFLQDFIIYKLTGKVITDYSLASITGMLDLKVKRWWSKLLDFIEIKQGMLPDLVEPGSRIGNLKSEVANQIGLDQQVAVCAAGLDQAVSTIGAGNIRPGLLVENTGTVIAVSTVFDEPFLDPNQKIPILCHSIPDKYYGLQWSPNGGSVLEWFRNSFSPRYNYEELIDEAMSTPPGSCDLIMLPHLAGAGSLKQNVKASGVFYGIRLGHNVRHFTRAVLESMGYVLKGNIEELEKLGARFGEVRSIGGGSRNSSWLQIKADITEKPFVSMKVKEEAAALGGCVLASVGLGYYKNYEEAVCRMVKIENRIQPNVKAVDVYRKAYLKYKEIYALLEPSWVR